MESEGTDATFIHVWVGSLDGSNMHAGRARRGPRSVAQCAIPIRDIQDNVLLGPSSV